MQIRQIVIDLLSDGSELNVVELIEGVEDRNGKVSERAVRGVLDHLRQGGYSSYRIKNKIQYWRKAGPTEHERRLDRWLTRPRVIN